MFREGTLLGLQSSKFKKYKRNRLEKFFMIQKVNKLIRTYSPKMRKMI